MGRRTNLRLAQSKPPLGQGFRGFDRQRQNLGLHRLRAAAHQEISLPITLLIRLRFGHLASSLPSRIRITSSRYSANSSCETPTNTLSMQIAQAISKAFESSANWCCLAVSS